MSADVLAAMDAMISDFASDLRLDVSEIVSGPCGNLIKARAAVAELIEAAEEAEQDAAMSGFHYERLRAALAKVQP